MGFNSGLHADNINVYKSGSNYHVGIGTVSPDRKVVIDAGAGYPLKLNATQDYLLGLARSGTEQWWFKVNTAGDFTIHENGVDDKFRIKAGGNVGIGVGTPLQKLHIKGDRLRIEETSAGRYLDIIPAVSGSAHRYTSTATGSGHQFENSSGTIALLDANGSAFYQDLTIASSNLRLSSAHYVQFGDATARIQGSAGSNYLKFYTGGTERLQINNTTATFSGDVIVSGGLTINGTTTTINSTTISVDDKNIELGSVASPSDTTADGGGITLKGASDYTINWTNSTDSWHFNQGITIGENDTGHDVKFYGATSNRYLHWNQAEDRLNLRDNTKFSIGNSNDLQLEFNGTHSYIKNNVGGSMYIQSINSIQLESNTGENMLVATANGAVELYHDNVKKFETTSAGVTVTGGLTVDGSPQAGEVRFNRDGINNSTYTMLCTVVGSRLASIINMTITGTSNSVVLGSAFEIIVNHYQDIHVRSTSSDYTEATIRITSNNDEDYSIELKHNGSTTTQVEVCIFPQAGETITPTTTDPNYTGSEYEHTATEGWRYGGEDNNVESSNVIIDGKVGIGLTAPTRNLIVAGTAVTNGIGVGTPTSQNGLELTTNGTNYEGFVLGHSYLAFGTNHLNVGTTASERMRITSGGLVGIGTTSPSAKLDIYAAPNTNSLFLRDSSDGEYTHNFWVDSAGNGHTYMYAEGNSLKNVFNTAGSSYFNGGNVGIGTTAPDTFHANANKLVVGSGSGAQGITIYSQNNNAGYLYFADGVSGSEAYRGAVSYNHSTEKLAFDAGGGTRMTITNGGLVGIGTTSPSNKLHINGGLQFTVSSYTQNAGTIGLLSNNLLYIRGGSAGTMVQNGDGTGTVQLSSGYTRFELGASEKMRLNTTGLGIGTSSPATKLDVNGGVNGTHLTLSGTAGRGLTIGSTNGSGQNDAEVVYNAADTESSAYHSKHIFQLGGSEKFKIYNDSGQGKVRFTANIFAYTAHDQIADFYSTDTTGYIRVRDSNDSTYLASDNTMGSFGGNAGAHANNLNINLTTGDVGIGTLAPSAKLHVAGGNILVDLQYGIRFADANTRIYTNAETPEDLIIEADQDLHLDPDGVVKVDTAEFQITSGAAYTTHLNYNNTGNNYISQANGGATLFRNSAGTLMQLNSSGQLGIAGTPNAANKLTVYGTTYQTDTSYWSNQGVASWSNHSGADFFGLRATGRDLMLASNSDWANGIIVKTDGKVGIGTVTPDEKLDVSGNLKVGQSASNGHRIGRKDYSITQTFTTGLTVTLANHTACHVKVFISGDWANHSSFAYVGEFFIQNAGNVGSYNEPGIILTEHDNLKTDGILSKIVDGTGDSFTIQFRANTSSSTSVSGRLCYHVMGDSTAVA